jgi:hypothetical protein
MRDVSTEGIREACPVLAALAAKLGAASPAARKGERLGYLSPRFQLKATAS